MTPLEETLQRMTLLYPVTVMHNNSIRHPQNVEFTPYEPHIGEANRWVMHGTAMIHVRQAAVIPGNPGGLYRIESAEFIPVAVPDADVVFSYTDKGDIVDRRDWEYNGLPGAIKQPLHSLYSWDQNTRQMRLAGNVEDSKRTVVDLGIPAEFRTHTYRTVWARYPNSTISVRPDWEPELADVKPGTVVLDDAA